MNLGLVGLGNMGGRIGKRLIEQGHQLHVYDVNRDTLNEFQSLGAKIADSLTELAKENKYVLTILPNADIVKDVILAENGLLSGLEPSSVVIDMTSSIPEVTKEIYGELKKKKIEMLDAPVSGGVKKAEDGSLAIMVGGEAATYKRVIPIFKSIGSKITHVGEIGTGHAVKALNNLISATTLAATLEAIAIGMKAGLDPYKMLDIVNNSTGKNNSSENKVAQQILSGKYEGRFTLDLMYKDLTTAINIAKAAEVPSPISHSVVDLWGDAETQMEGKNVDHTEIARYIGGMSGVDFDKRGSKIYSECSKSIDN
ncbi:NAD(P)-dependent oxidoreductase [Halobacillus shinanisalinarum]|uniref:NAD(P)-dependent oxidoreductase n=1 Tax=Halobacillus shinanisalinarum TaxID=2932258 RepID=A0ABY4H442_9BACI|nr:NAD(P)-dependent oxidoreductase [Halobacillus shinanisalinarum]UOQ94889.1 NAD(P)-dependent oxidoreductase [Halobacillus shinanisalinarum]